MLTLAAVLAALAALIHVYIFVLESLRWTDPATRRIFGTTEAQAEIMKPMALNQGFYNLFLAIITVIGLAVTAADRQTGISLALAGTGSMLAAALVLIASDRSKARPAVIQGALPLLAVVLLAASL